MEKKLLNQPVLYNYFRSSTSVRVRIALNLKGIDYKYVSLHLRKKEHQTEEYLKINPYGLLPAIEFPSGMKLNQSLAILEYLDEIYPTPAIIPVNSLERAKVRSMAYAIALFVRDHALKLKNEGIQLNKNALDHIGKSGFHSSSPSPGKNAWKQDLGSQEEDLTWLL